MTSVVDAKPRNDSIDFVKLVAVFLVLNSHMGLCYGSHSFLATGGAIGDALFFFVSGFTLFLGGKYRFDNWYKRRLSRIYPSVLATGIVACLLFKSEDSFFDVITAKRYWFVQCIFIYYILLYPIKTYVSKVWIAFTALFALVVAAYFLFFDFTGKGIFWGSDSYFRWMFFFLIVLQGAMLGKQGHITFRVWHLPALLVCIAAWYGVCFFFNGVNWQILSVIPMFGITYFLYSVSNNSLVKKTLQTKMLKKPVLLVGSLCLESYLIQKYLITDSLNNLFPLNIPIIMLLVLLFAFFVRMVSEFIRQVFSADAFDYKKMFLFFNR